MYQCTMDVYIKWPFPKQSSIKYLKTWTRIISHTLSVLRVQECTPWRLPFRLHEVRKPSGCISPYSIKNKLGVIFHHNPLCRVVLPPTVCFVFTAVSWFQVVTSLQHVNIMTSSYWHVYDVRTGSMNTSLLANIHDIKPFMHCCCVGKSCLDK